MKSSFGLTEFMQVIKMTIEDLLAYPKSEGNRYELISGELHVSTAPPINHQLLGYTISMALGK
jgi:hypothetical protein